MKHTDISEIVFGLALDKKLDPEHIPSSALIEPYGEALKLLKNGADISDLYDKVGLAPIKAALEAGRIVNSENPYDMVALLEKAYSRESLALTLEKEASKLRKGGDADILKLETSLERHVNMEDRYTPLDEIEPLEGVWVHTGYKPIDEYIGGIPDSNLTIIAAPPGCLVGNTSVGINRGGKSFQCSMRDLECAFNGGRINNGRMWMKDIPTTIRTRWDDGTIRLTPIKSVLYSGRKKVYKLTLRNGMSVVGTTDHPIYGEDGWKQLGQLLTGEKVWVESPKRAKGDRQPKLQYREHEGLRFHPHAHTHSKHPLAVARHILVIEADINNVPVDLWIKMG